MNLHKKVNFISNLQKHITRYWEWQQQKLRFEFTDRSGYF